MIFYPTSSIRPDISFDFYQCRWFTSNNKSYHETAVKRICQYLQGTKDNVIVFNPSKKMVVDFYADAYFAGLWGYENPQDNMCTRSRTLFVVIFPILLYCGCQNYTHIFISILYIMRIWYFLVLLDNYFS